ncbi:MAG: hypothetical protein ABI590_05825, partial [Ilumatobacteraceae bacterium]
VAERVQKQVATARVVGKFAVQLGWRQTDRAIRNLIGSMSNSKSAPAVVEREIDTHLAIANYQQIVAVDIIAQLGSLTIDELHNIAEFENSHRRRRTVLHKIDQLLSTERFKQP